MLLERQARFDGAWRAQPNLAVVSTIFLESEMAVSGATLNLEVVIRCRDFEVSRSFHATVLQLPALQEWQEEQGRGCIFGCGEGG